MSVAGRIKENPKAFYVHIKRKRVAKERVGPFKDSGRNVCVVPDVVGEVLKSTLHPCPHRRRMWLMASVERRMLTI